MCSPATDTERFSPLEFAGVKDVDGFGEADPAGPRYIPKAIPPRLSRSGGEAEFVNRSV